jgi:bifunctional UDP-N-acetylglucosamine pyrophosphorylase/glucosamine-1-phosphate N-acetyltransferase
VSLAWTVVILAAGKGTRMKSPLPKVLHSLAGRPLLDHVLDLALRLAPPERVVTVVGHGAARVAAVAAARGARTVLQEPQLGTGDAVRVALEAVAPGSGGLVVLSGDVPLLRPGSVEALCRAVEAGAAAAVLTAVLDEPGAYGRVLRHPGGGVTAIVEARDATPEQLRIREVNAGVYAFRRQPLEEAIATLRPDNDQGEYYLTDVVHTLRERGLPVAAHVLADPLEMAGVNTPADLRRLEETLSRPH